VGQPAAALPPKLTAADCCRRCRCCRGNPPPQVEQQMRNNQGMGQEDDMEIARLEHENTQLR
jgi:hypothetical protein